jgi:hypothetical protein
MKNVIFIAVLSVILILGCKKSSSTSTPKTTTQPPNTTVNQQGTLSFSIGNGSALTAATGSLTCSLLNNELNIYGATSSNNYAVNLFIPNAVGTYTLNAGSNYAIFYNNLTNNSYQTNSTYTGTVAVTQYDATGKTVSGTYSFNALSTTSGTGTSTVSITNGNFTNISF